MLDGFTKLCSNYQKGVLLASQKAFRWTPFVTNNVKVVNLRANANWCRKMIQYGWARRASFFFLWFAGVHARNHIDPGIVY